LIVLSLINRLFVTLYPVTASIVGAHPLEPLATVCLSANSLASAIPLAFLNVYLAYADWVLCAPVAAWSEARMKATRY
jgi:hypothetical protein